MTATDLISAFKARVAAFQQRTGMSDRLFGKLACNDSSFISDLRSGTREPRLSTIEKIDGWMAGYEPSAADQAEVAHG